MTTTTWLRSTAPGMAALIALGLTACAPEDVAEFEEGEPSPTQDQAPDESAEADAENTAGTTTGPADTDGDDGNAGDAGEMLVAEVDDPVTFEECEDAEASDEASVTWLDDVTFEEEELAAAVSAETVEVNGEQVELPGAPAVIMPERTAQAGCIIEYDAPGGCLPALEISAAYVPGYTLPERAIPAVELPDGTVLHELLQHEVTVAPIEIHGVTAEEVCQEEDDAEEGDTVWGVTRWGETRWGETQWGETVWSETRWSETLEGGENTPTMTLDTFASDTLSMETVQVETESLETYRLEGSEHTEYSAEKEVTSYTTEGDVLFDSDEYELRDEAEAELQGIAEDIAQRDGDYVVEVEGHTDDLPTSVYDDNYELSELRAESVVDWLVDNADLAPSAISAEGLGEDYPRADNDTDEGRQQNRRVVITVQPEDYEPEVDYELEEAED